MPGRDAAHGSNALSWVLPLPAQPFIGRTGGRPRGVAVLISGLIALPSLGVALRDLSPVRNLSGTRAMVPLAAPCPLRTLNPGAISVPWDTVLAAEPQDPDANWPSVT